MIHHFQNWKDRIRIVKKAKKTMKLHIENGKEVFLHAVEVSVDEAKKLIKRFIVFGKRSEPLTVTRILAHEPSK